MDGIHDLGGMQGFGPITTETGDETFHHDWEARMWGIARSGILGREVTIDWFRHGIECMVPSDYLSYQYFQKWCTTYFMLLVDNDILSMDEIEGGTAKQRFAPPPGLTVDEALTKLRKGNTSFEVEPETLPRYQPGDRVRTRRHMEAGHTRLPAYARDALGEIISHHGAHLLADKGACGVREGQHLYTVAFTARELWGQQANPRDSVTLELWESYLVPA